MQDMCIIPRPSETTLKEGFFQGRSLPPVTGDARFSNETAIFRAQMNDAFERADNMRMRSESAAQSIVCSHGTGFADEGYGLIITEREARIEASGTKGCYRGLQTLRQLLAASLADSEGREFRIPCAEIRDEPRFPWRGFMLDCSRTFFSAAFVKKQIDLISLYGMNTFHWHLTDDQGWRLPVKGWPKLTEIGAWRTDYHVSAEPDHIVGGFYTEEEIREVVAYATARHIEVIPEIDLPGHASAILAAHPELGCTGGPYAVEDRYGIFPDVLCAGTDKIFDFAAAVFDALGDLFPSRFVHIGGDEVRFERWKECPRCSLRMKELGLGKPEELQAWITMRLANMLHERGKTAIGWDEVLHETEKLGLPENLIVMSWTGTEGGFEAARRGHRVVMTPMTDGCYLNFKPLDSQEEPGRLDITTVKQSYAFDPAPPVMTAEQAALVEGGQCNFWSEGIDSGRIAEYLVYPRLCAVAESLWTRPERKNFESFKGRLRAHRKMLDLLDVCHYRGPLE